MAKGVRDTVTLIAAGGIAQAEHMAKVIICGADLVVVDIPFLIALECRMCMNCTLGRPCPVDIAGTPAEHGARRITNLAASWHSQLLEVLGAMGIREVRRLRGEYGRAMFQEDLERETFQALFAGKRAKGQ
jgi:glutamate synthase domain-containing protein 2